MKIPEEKSDQEMDGPEDKYEEENPEQPNQSDKIMNPLVYIGTEMTCKTFEDMDNETPEIFKSGILTE